MTIFSTRLKIQFCPPLIWLSYNFDQFLLFFDATLTVFDIFDSFRGVLPLGLNLGSVVNPRVPRPFFHLVMGVGTLDPNLGIRPAAFSVTCPLVT